METRSAKRKKLVNAAKARPRTDHTEEDRISDLPDDILHHVFFFLPIKSIAQTSVLSKRWKNLWYSFPDLDFTTVNTLSNASIVMSSTVRKRARSYVSKGAEYVDQILSLLEKHSDIRVLRFRAFLSFSRLVALIRHAVKHNVQELDVEVSTTDYFNFPRSVINSATLRALRLKSWHPGFRLPPLEIMKAGFRSLSLLSLSRAILHDQPTLVNLFTDSSFPLLKKLHLEACFGLKHLRVECPALEDLSLESCFQLQHLEITVQKLERLKVSSCFDAYSISTRVMIEAPTLQIMSWSYNAITEECILHNLTSLHEVVVGFFLLQEDLNSAKVQSVSNFLTGISSCHSLTLETQCIQQWNKDLWQSPSSGEERYWESQTQSLKPFLYHLKVVKIHGFTECENDISLVKFFLKNGKVLQEVFLFTSLSKPKDSLLREKIKSQIMGFSRASSNANIPCQATCRPLSFLLPGRCSYCCCWPELSAGRTRNKLLFFVKGGSTRFCCTPLGVSQPSLAGFLSKFQAFLAGVQCCCLCSVLPRFPAAGGWFSCCWPPGFDLMHLVWVSAWSCSFFRPVCSPCSRPFSVPALGLFWVRLRSVFRHRCSLFPTEVQLLLAQFFFLVPVGVAGRVFMVLGDQLLHLKRTTGLHGWLYFSESFPPFRQAFCL
ncbi:putative F-box/FBD/LRR-repeat protein [Sesamum alatum]|uniref:F-box/FBD/LRR-repeat protein n=1 Tax=Sesamum alatum TaxID=300844 RepID=A0AAE2CWN5_9LAMI|nr:putative F-box/FBD/LRR-repeat protein [Sesamum alatum]